MFDDDLDWRAALIILGAALLRELVKYIHERTQKENG